MKFLSDILIKAGLVVEGSSTLQSLAGTGTRMVVANAAGLVSTQAIPVTSVSGTGGYGGLTLSGTVTSTGSLTLGGTPTGTWPISITGNAATVTIANTNVNTSYYIPLVSSAGNVSLLIDGGNDLNYNPSTNVFTIGGSIVINSVVINGGTANQFMKANGTLDSNTYMTGSGVAGRVAIWDSASNLTGSNSLLYDTSTGNLSIGGSGSSYRLNVLGVGDSLIGQVITATSGRINIYPYHSATYGGLMESRNLLDTASQPITLSGSNVILLGSSATVTSLAGTGVRMVVTDASGVLSSQAIPVSSVTSVFGRTSAVVAQSGDYTTTLVTEGTNLYYTDARARAAISLTTTGSSGAATYSAGVLNIPNYTLSGLSGSTGVSGEITYWTGASSQGSSSNLFWDIANSNLGIGANPSTANRLHVGGNTFSNTISTNGGINLNRNGDEANLTFQRDGNPTAQLRALNGGGFRITAAAATTEWARFHATGNFTIGAITDTTERLQVAGNVKIVGSGATSGTTALLVENSDGTDILNVRNDRYAIYGTAALPSGIYLGSSLKIYQTQNSTTENSANQDGYFIGSTGSTNSTYSKLWLGFTPATGFNSTIGNPRIVTIQGSFIPTSGTSTFGSLVLENTINQTGGANGITRGLYINPTLTAAADWRSIEWSNNSGWGLHGTGTAPNYLAGSLAIGTKITGNYNLRIGRNISGATTANNITLSSTVASDVTVAAYGIDNISSTQAATFTLGSYYLFMARQGTFGVGSSVINQFGFRVESSLVGATNNYGFYGDIPSGTGRWNLYMNGTAENYLGGLLRVNNQITAGTAQATSGSTILRSTYSSGNISNIGTNGSSGGMSINYAVYPASTSTADAYLSGVGTLSFPRSSYIVQADHRWLSAASAIVAEGSAVTMTENMRLYNDGNLVLQTGGTYTNSTQKLQVYGDTLMKGTGNTSGTTALTVQNSDATNILRVRNDGAVLLGAALTYTNVSSRAIFTTADEMRFSRTAAATDTSGSKDFFQILTSFAPTSGTALYNFLLINNGVNQTGGASGITRGLYVNPNLVAAADWRSIEWSNNSGYGLYGAGTAQNLFNGKLTVNVTVPTGAFANANTMGVFGSQVLNIPTGTQGVAGAVYAANSGFHYFRFNGNTTLVGDALWAASISVANLQFDTTGTITLPDGAGGGSRPRALSGIQIQMQSAGNNNGTITRAAGLLIQGCYPSTGTGVTTFDEFAGIRINNLTEWGTARITMTDRWGIFQAGADDKNHFNGSVLIGTSTVGGSKLKVSGLPTSATGLTAGDIWNNGGVLNIV